MLRFKVYQNRKPATRLALESAYLVGGDGVPLRGEITFANGEIRCAKRAAGPAALSLVWPVEGFGRLMLETTRLQEREQPYSLHVELARGRLMRISQKREDWGLYDYPEGGEYYRRIDQAKGTLVDALTAADDATAAACGEAALAGAVQVGEELSLFHADLFLKRRRAMSQFVKRPFGVGVSLAQSDEAYRGLLPEVADFAVLPISWRDVEGETDVCRWEALDLWVNWLGQHRTHIRSAPLVSLDPAFIPEWVVRAKPTYDKLKEMMLGHAVKLVKRFAHRIQSWEVVRGLHAFNTLHLSLEQLMDLTRSAALVVKHNAPRSTTIVTIAMPFGEYYARDPRTIPAALYADLCVQSGFNFDAFGLAFEFSSGDEGSVVRDMMQISAVIDRFANFGKPLHITGIQVPSTPAPKGTPDNGCWHEAWSEQLQARFLRAFYEIAFSKPFVETVTWTHLRDGDSSGATDSGLLRSDLSTKPAYQQLLEFRRGIVTERRAHRSRS